LLLAGCGNDAGAAQLPAADAALRAGRYEQAIEAYRALARDGREFPAAARGLARALSLVGRYDEAEAALRTAAAAAGPDSLELANALGEVLYARGKVEEAERRFRAAAEGGASDSLLARLNLGVLLHEGGGHEAAFALFDGFIDVYNEGAERLDSRELMAVGIAVRYLGVRDPQLYKDALRALDEAAAADSGNLDARIRIGELFLEKYNSGDAKAAFREVLAINPSHPLALLGMARAAEFDGEPGALELARKALEVNPNLVPAHVLVARLELEAENHEAAARAARRALEVDPSSSDAMGVLAAAHYLAGDTGAFEEVRRRALARNPRNAGLYNELAEMAARNRRYAEAVEFARQAVALDSLSWRARGILGINRLRIGEIEEGRNDLERAFAGDPYDVWTKNTLDLLDTFGRYREVPTARFRLVLFGEEADVLAPYMAPLAEEAYDRLAERYRFRPATPIRVEVFPSHADFSVRTIGLAGLGALGVSFGRVLAMDSPSARDRGEFNWGSTFWHELAHTFHMGMTDHRVPRWFTEGLAVLEERRARDGWGSDVSLPFLAAYEQGRLLPVSRLNDGFTRPDSPEQVALSYHQASLVCELIEQEHGTDALLRMLDAYRRGLATPEVFRQVLGADLEAFDRRFDAYLKQRFAGPLAAIRPRTLRDTTRTSEDDAVRLASREPDDFLAQLRAGRALFAAGQHDEAIPFLERAKALFPEHAAAGGPYELLARIWREKGDLRRAAAELERMTALNERAYQQNVELAEILEQLGDARGAAAALERAIYIDPLEPALHERLADLYARIGEREKAVREREVILALAPVDRAQALYRLAAAQLEAGDAAAARRTVLRALEIAPNFERAQELLLRLRDAGRDRQPQAAGGGARREPSAQGER
jgi:tetratricopeptide (TPR) repeat protein